MSTLKLERALQATARIAGVALALGCAPTVATVEVPDRVSATTDVPEPDPEPDPDPSCDVLLDELVADLEEGDGIDADEATLACCEDLLDEIETTGTWPTEPRGQAAQWACCSTLEFPDMLACTPWGPPAPPAALPARRVA